MECQEGVCAVHAGDVSYCCRVGVGGGGQAGDGALGDVQFGRNSVVGLVGDGVEPLHIWVVHASYFSIAIVVCALIIVIASIFLPLLLLVRRLYATMCIFRWPIRYIMSLCMAYA